MKVVFSPDTKLVTCAMKECLSARETLDVAMFLIGSKRAANYLVKAHRKGIILRIIVDGKVAKSKHSMAGYLRRHGIDVRTVKVSRGFMHAKFIIIDGKRVLAGSANLTNDANRRNHEFMFMVEDKEIVSLFMDKFNELWGISR